VRIIEVVRFNESSACFAGTVVLGISHALFTLPMPRTMPQSRQPRPPLAHPPPLRRRTRGHRAADVRPGPPGWTRLHDPGRLLSAALEELEGGGNAGGGRGGGGGGRLALNVEQGAGEANPVEGGEVFLDIYIYIY
jgi:hypothetical protein